MSVQRVARAADEGMDASAGAWLAICDEHSTLVGCSTRAVAESGDTLDFCDECRDAPGAPTVCTACGTRVYGDDGDARAHWETWHTDMH